MDDIKTLIVKEFGDKNKISFKELIKFITKYQSTGARPVLAFDFIEIMYPYYKQMLVTWGYDRLNRRVGIIYNSDCNLLINYHYKQAEAVKIISEYNNQALLWQNVKRKSTK